MDCGIEGKVAMVAAGSKGIGLAAAKALALEGCRVSVCARDPGRLERAVAEIGEGAMGFVADVAQVDDLQRWFEQTREQLGSPDILVTNTGGPPAGRIGEMSDQQWQSGVDSTLMNVVRLYRLVSPGMAQRGWGRIVHITSLVAKEPSPILPISSALRAGLMALTRLQALEMAPSGVTVNSVLPGHTMTDRQVHLAEIRAAQTGLSVEDALSQQAASIPMRRIAEPDEIAAPIAFLCSARASYITGVNLLVDGGATKGFG